MTTNGYLEGMVEFNPGELETNPDKRLEQGLNPVQPHANPTP